MLTIDQAKRIFQLADSIYHSPNKERRRWDIGTKKILRYIAVSKDSEKNGSYLLSHLSSTIGVTGLNFSVRNGKRWNPRAIAT